ncbi:MAG: penicillin-binding protein 1C, partial [bacterium]
TRPVCPVSGLPPGPHCPGTVEGDYLPARSTDEACRVHVEARIDAATGKRLCPLCARGRAYDLRLVESWPVELAAWLRAHGRGDGLMPPHFPGCPRGDGEAAPPRILSPAQGHTYLLAAHGDAAGQRLLLKAASRSEELYWFIDGTLYATAAPLAPTFWPLARGRHTVVVADEAGRSAGVTIDVQ